MKIQYYEMSKDCFIKYSFGAVFMVLSIYKSLKLAYLIW